MANGPHGGLSIQSGTIAALLRSRMMKRSPPPNVVVQDVPRFQLHPPGSSQLTIASQAASGRVVCLTPSTDPAGSWSEATVSDSKPGEMAAELATDLDLERDEEALSDMELDSDDEDALGPTPPLPPPQHQFVFSTAAVTGDLAETVSQIQNQEQSANNDQAPASTAASPPASAAVPSAVH